MATYNVLNNRPLWDWYSIRIEEIGGSKHVFFQSRIHLNKELHVSFQFSTEFSDWEILNDRDLITWVFNRYGSEIFSK